MKNEILEEFFDTLSLSQLLEKLRNATCHRHYCPCTCYCFNNDPCEYSVGDVTDYILNRFKEKYE